MVGLFSAEQLFAWKRENMVTQLCLVKLSDKRKKPKLQRRDPESGFYAAYMSFSARLAYFPTYSVSHDVPSIDGHLLMKNRTCVCFF